MSFISILIIYQIDLINDSKPYFYRLAFAEAALYLGILCGNTAGPYLYPMFPSHGYEGVFAIGFFFCLIALLYVVFLLPESIEDNEVQVSMLNMNSFIILKLSVGFKVVFLFTAHYARTPESTGRLQTSRRPFQSLL